MLSDQVYQNELLYSEKMPGQMRTVKEKGMKEGSLCSMVLPQAQEPHEQQWGEGQS